MTRSSQGDNDNTNCKVGFISAQRDTYHITNKVAVLTAPACSVWRAAPVHFSCQDRPHRAWKSVHHSKINIDQRHIIGRKGHRVAITTARREHCRGETLDLDSYQLERLSRRPLRVASTWLLVAPRWDCRLSHEAVIEFFAVSASPVTHSSYPNMVSCVHGIGEKNQ